MTTKKIQRSNKKKKNYRKKNTLIKIASVTSKSLGNVIINFKKKTNKEKSKK